MQGEIQTEFWNCDTAVFVRQLSKQIYPVGDRALVMQSCEEELRDYMSNIGSATAPPSIPECRSGALLEIWKG